MPERPTHRDLTAEGGSCCWSTAVSVEASDSERRRCQECLQGSVRPGGLQAPHAFCGLREQTEHTGVSFVSLGELHTRTLTWRQRCSRFYLVFWDQKVIVNNINGALGGAGPWHIRQKKDTVHPGAPQTRNEKNIDNLFCGVFNLIVWFEKIVLQNYSKRPLELLQSTAAC